MMLNCRPTISSQVELDSAGMNGIGQSAPGADLSGAMSLRQVLVPVLSSGQRLQPEQDPTYSPNNRGGGYSAFRTGHRFGERTSPIDPYKLSRKSQLIAMRRRYDKQMTAAHPKGGWSQPDPRQTYSLQLNTLEGTNHSKTKTSASATKLFPLSSRFKGAGLSEHLRQSASGKSLKRASDYESSSGKQTNPNTTVSFMDEDLLPASWKGGFEQPLTDYSSPQSSNLLGSGSNRRKSSLQPNMIALIRYVPVLLNVPAQQLLLPVQPRSVQASPVPQRGPAVPEVGHSDAGSPTYYSLYRAPSERLVRYQVSGEPTMAELAGQFQRLNQPQAGEQQSMAAVSPGFWSAPSNQAGAGGGPAAMALQTTDLLLEQDYNLPHAAYHPGNSNGLQATIALIQPSELGAAMSLTGIPAAAAARLAYLPLAAGQTAPAVSTMSKAALSSYASKLISMLRPSALLSSIAPPHPPQTGSTGAHQPPGPPLNQQIYLIAPESLSAAANRAAVTQSGYSAAVAGVNQPRPMALIKADDLLLNQASTKLHASSSSVKSSTLPRAHPPTSWLHEQPNGLICVHNVIQSGLQTSKSTYEAPGRSTRFQPAPLLLSPFILADQQTLLGPTTSTVGPLSTPDSIDNGSFDYVPVQINATTESSSFNTKQEVASWPTKSSATPQSVKESPAKLGKKIKSQSSSEQTLAYNFQELQQTQLHDELHFDSEFADKKQPKPLVGSSSESRSILDSNNSSSSSRQDKGPKPEEPPQSGGWVSDEPLKQSIIPFTIKDKIELPLRRGTGGTRSFHSNDPVQYDEQAEGETEPPPKQVAGKQSSWPVDERRAKTSFVSSTARYSTPISPTPDAPSRQKAKKVPSHEIDYLKEVSQNSRDTISGYTLPLLIASSAGSRRGAEAGSSNSRNQRVQENNDPSGFNDRFRSRRPVGITSAPPPLPTPSTVSELGASGSSPVTTSSTLDGQPVTLSSGRLDFNTGATASAQPRRGLQSADESQLILVSSSSLSTLPVDTKTSNKTSLSNGHQHKGRPAGPEVVSAAPIRSSSAPLELVVNSSRAEPQLSATDDPVSLVDANESRLSTATTLRVLAKPDESSTEPTASTTTYSSSTEKVIGGNDEQQPPRSNHLPETATSSGLFSHDRSLSMGAGGSTDEFGRISESLQTNPIDLIDLQNSRSSFALPAQLESWSMFVPHQQHQHPHQQGRLESAKRSS